jgi:hypothetical protein
MHHINTKQNYINTTRLGGILGEGGKNQERTNIWSFLKMSTKNY